MAALKWKYENNFSICALSLWKRVVKWEKWCHVCLWDLLPLQDAQLRATLSRDKVAQQNRAVKSQVRHIPYICDSAKKATGWYVVSECFYANKINNTDDQHSAAVSANYYLSLVPSATVQKYSKTTVAYNTMRNRKLLQEVSFAMQPPLI